MSGRALESRGRAAKISIAQVVYFAIMVPALIAFYSWDRLKGGKQKEVTRCNTKNPTQDRRIT